MAMSGGCQEDDVGTMSLGYDVTVLCEPTHLLAVGEGAGPLGVNEDHTERGLHGGLVEAGEGLPGERRLHLRGGQHPDTGQNPR